MKKLLLMLTLASMPFCIHTSQAQGLFSKKEFKGKLDRSAYMQGAVPVENGQIIFHEEIKTDKPAAEVFNRLKQWASLRYMPEMQRGVWTDDDYFKNFEYAKVNSADGLSGVIECSGDEELVFTNKTLARDATRITYLLSMTVGVDKILFSMHVHYFTYSLGEIPERIQAIDWISDAEAFNKKGELLHNTAKFRIKTIDLKNELVKEITEAVSE